MGHFGKRPIRIAWFALVLPALLINYFGQGALLLRDPDGRHQPVLPARAARHARAAGDPRDARRGDRVAGADLRRVLAHAAGRAARLLAARHDHPHLEDRSGADLHSRSQPDADGRLPAARRLASRSRSRSARRTASPSRARWRSRRCSSTSSRAARWNWSLLHVLPITLALPRHRPDALLGERRSRSRTAAGCRSSIAIGVFTLMSTWKKGRNPAQPRAPRRRAAARPVSRATSSGGSRRACRAPRCS